MVFIVLGFAALHASSARAAEPPLGIEVEDHGSLRDMWGRQRPLSSFDGYAAVVLAFLGTDCPLANRCLPQLMELEAQYRKKNVQFIGIYPHEHETLDLIAAHAVDYDVPFPVLKDIDQGLAGALKVERTPTFCILDENFALRYHGRLSDQFAVGTQRAKPRRADLALALDELLSQQSVSVRQTPVDGCLLDRARPPESHTELTFEEQIAPIFARRCQACHRPRRPGPFSLLTYDDAVRWSAMIREVIVQRRMPPWHADARYGKFHNDRRMTAEEIDQVVSWINGGMPRGHAVEPAATAAQEPEPSKKFDVVLATSKTFLIPAEGVVDYVWSEVPAKLTDDMFQEDRWVCEAQVRPQDPAVVHHIMVFTSPRDVVDPMKNLDKLRVLAMWAPGEPSFAFPPDTAVRIPRGSRLILQMHYTPNGKATTDRPVLKLCFAKETPEWEIAMRTHENRTFRIAPGDPHARAEYVFRIEAEQHTRLVGLYPHMHVRGKSFTFEAEYPDGRRELLLSIPRYDFNWQTFYWFDKPVTIPIGGAIHAVAHWDNSRNNLDNLDPSAEVGYGWQTNEEMMIAGLMFMYRPVQQPTLAGEKLPASAQGATGQVKRPADSLSGGT